MKEHAEIQLIELVGEHIFDAVDFSNEQVKKWSEAFEACQVMRFRLDGKCYIATEDPDDGYRSCMGNIVISDDAEMKNVFTPSRIVGRHRTQGYHGHSADVLELIDCATGQIVLEVGTESLDDYYPCFVAGFHPEAMSINNKSGDEV